ncbi:FKBP12-associated protein [Coemansia biformis]|uniref:FKBP12-associated protein n=1 Tax=Coemansia biformis TaxID=1286918 RepID=A0A9W7YCD5_9FUNG|nr:FKBP12-associated protein [Coemansia biformis]
MCDESRPCEVLVDLTCACGRMSSHELCGATAANARGGVTRRIACNEVCKIAERNRRLALALDLKDRAEAPLSGLIKATFSDHLLRFARANLAYVRDVEARAAAFVGDRGRSALNFAPMKWTSRAFLHALAPYYGCKSRSVDSEPLRSVCWDKHTRSTIPSIALSSAIRYTQAPQMVCSDRVAEADDSDFDDSGSHVFDRDCWGTHTAGERLRRKLDHIVIQNLRHALTADELRAEFDRLIPGAPYTIAWTGEDEVVLRCTDATAGNEYLVKWEAMLKAKLPRLGVAGIVKGVAGALPSTAATPARGTPASGTPAWGTPAPGTPTASPTQTPARAPGSPAAARASRVGHADESGPVASDGDGDIPDDWESLCD